MRVLHVYSQEDLVLARYVGMLTQALPEDVETQTADNAKAFHRSVADFRPDIIHLHGLPPCQLPSKVRLVVSTHGKTVTGNPYCVVTRSQLEARRLKAPRTETVLNPLITKAITPQEAGRKMAYIYQRVMDSNPLELMDAPTRLMLAKALKVGLCGDSRWVDTTNLDTHIDWRHLYIYAREEGVLPIVESGIRLLFPDASLSSFLPSLSSIAAIFLPSALYAQSGRDSHNSAPPPPRTIARILDDIRKNGITLLHLTELFRALYDDQLDEEALMKQLESQKLRHLFQSMLQILKEQLLLDEGFMPCPPVDDRQTARLRRQLENHLKL
jgi:hypothetical protein